MSDSALVLGPLIRYVDETSASIWVETADTGTVTVEAGGRSWRAPTFRVHGHHYALVVCEGLEPGSITPYDVAVDGQPVWPPAEGDGASYPPSVIATLKPGKPLRMAYGSCRTSVGHDEAGNQTHGVDALRALALKMATEDGVRWPDLVLFLGDQVYADETTEEMQEFIRQRRDVDEPPGEELKDYEEYAHLYKLAWSDPVNRWLLSTLPSLMIFDDHDVRDDWNTSWSWRQDIEQTEWWQERIVSGLASYWVYQHVGNLSPDERAKDEDWQRIVAHDGDDELDVSDALDGLADRSNQDPETYRWSFVREFPDVRLVVVDSRAARVLKPGERSLLDPTELAWLDEQMRGDVKHLLVGTSLPFLLPPGLHYLEAWNEAVAAGAWGGAAAAAGEQLRQAVDLEHWGAFQAAFQSVARMAIEVANGLRGRPPQTVTFLSGDVHHSYVSEVTRTSDVPSSRIVQAVCSPIRNPLPIKMRFATAALAYAIAGPMGKLVARSVKVADAPFRWHNLIGPWFDNNIALLEDREDGLFLEWYTGVVDGDDHAHPRLQSINHVLVEPPGAAG
ncbi:MAG: alkaline phosphatase family protein [Nocardioidaceae bacterium]|nr:alkaline phosphatase family protein [Nocardioidaceae bacterium]